MKEKIVRLLMNVLKFKNKEDCKKSMEKNRPIILFCKQLSY